MRARAFAIVGTPAVAALILLGGAPSASAGEQHKHHDGKATCATHCRPAPLPKPAGGWPCAKTHSCGTKHHRPVCPPVVKPPVKPPVTPVPKPPHVTKPVVPVVHHQVPQARVRLTAASPQLPRTGPAEVLPLLFASGAFVCVGGALRLASGFRTGPKHRDLP